MILQDGDCNPIIPQHRISIYIKSRMQNMGWYEDKILSERSKISTAEISRLKNDDRNSLSPVTFIKLVKTFQDSIEEATKIIYPDLDLTIGKYSPPERNMFGSIMSEFELSKNSPEEISVKTGIPLKRIRLIYFKTGSPDTYELLLIEKAIGEKSGVLFEKYLRKKEINH